MGDRVETTALRDTADTRLGRAVAPLAMSNDARPADPGAYLETGRPVRAGLFALSSGREALAARVVLADAAERALDIQYYIWRDDRSGIFMFNAIRRAADRGVRVRLLIDDNGTAGLDSLLRALDSHPGVEVRLFNPFPDRRARLLGYLTDFRRLNRRMHNKSFTADNQATIVGGRNIGDEYFDATDDVAFADLDVIAVGAVVDQVSTDFDRYWSSESAYPVDRLLKPVSAEAQAALTARVVEAGSSPDFQDYLEEVRNTQFLRDLFDGNLKLEWAMTRLVSDDPGKVLGRSPPPVPLAARLQVMLGQPQRVLEIVSPYFVPMQEGVDYLVSLARQGVQVRVLTNSLAATDVVAVHGGYAPWRKPLLGAGVTLHEHKALAPTPGSPGSNSGRSVRSASSAGTSSAALPETAGSRGSVGSGGSGGFGGPSSSSSSLHAKTYVVDRSRIVIGSFNFDPRSLHLNTELGFIIDSPALAGAVDDAFGKNVPRTAWQVTLTPSGDLQWTGQSDGTTVRHNKEPDAGFWRRAGARFFSILPIDRLL